jgi:hypothetical protein
MCEWLIVYSDDNCNQLVKKKTRSMFTDQQVQRFDEVAGTLNDPRTQTLPVLTLDKNKDNVKSFQC